MQDKIVIIGTSKINLGKKRPQSKLTSIYGVGRTRAKKLLTMLLTHRKSLNFKVNLMRNVDDPQLQKLFKSFESDESLKLKIYSNLERKAKIGCYTARRILQNLPSRGQRTHTNAGTPKKLNPFVKLGVKEKTTQELMASNKLWEVRWNGRPEEMVSKETTKKKKKYNKKLIEEKKRNKILKEKEKQMAKEKK